MRHVLRAVPVVLAAVALVAVLAVVAGGRNGGSLPATSGPAGARTLIGPWVVRGDRADRGEPLGWPQGGFSGRSVQLPFSPNARHVTGPDGARSFQGSVAWYRTAFTVTTAGDYAVALRVGQPPGDGVDRRPAASRATRAPTCPSRLARTCRRAAIVWSCGPTTATRRR